MALSKTQLAAIDVELERESPLPKSSRRTDLPVLLLHNLDDAWEPADLEKALDEVDDLEKALRRQGHPVTNIPVYDSDLASRLRNYNPDEYIVFNGCEGFPGIPCSEATVAKTLESLGFTYTGSPPEVLATGCGQGQGQEAARKPRGADPRLEDLQFLSHERVAEV